MALCEHVDNSIGAGANEIRIDFSQTGRPGALQTDVLVYDDGPGITHAVLAISAWV
ncbi:ATP-binding protein [Methylorubrum extorquens]|uniref:ATP-binding protein n=1 Tax=Methylorubrum extorquens TaxID=408 RepID=UPI001EE60F99|nr:ATP-binding protein [Methylorubrum extorquens]MCG5248411.1 ATP-binding protein [Methylorubrum extorquens]